MKKIFCILVIILITKNLEAQNDGIYRDAGMWNTLNLSYKINKKYTALFTQELRLRENYSRLNLFYNNIGLQYTIKKELKTSLVYRNIQKYLETNAFSIRHRLMWDVVYKHDFSKAYLSYRHRLQAEVRDLNKSKLGNKAEIFSRNKFEIGYKPHKKYSVYVATELRYQIIDIKNVQDDENWTRARFITGIDYQLNKAVSLGINFLHQREFATKTPQYLYITGLECNVNLNKLLAKTEKKSKKKKETKVSKFPNKKSTKPLIQHNEATSE